MTASQIIINTPEEIVRGWEVKHLRPEGSSLKVAQRAERVEGLLEKGVLLSMLGLIVFLISLVVCMFMCGKNGGHLNNTITFVIVGPAFVLILGWAYCSVQKDEMPSKVLVPIRGLLDVLYSKPFFQMLENGPTTLYDMQEKARVILDGLAQKVVEEEIKGLKAGPSICNNTKPVWSATYDIDWAKKAFKQAISDMKKSELSDGVEGPHYDRVPKELKKLRADLKAALDAALESVLATAN